MHTRVHVRTNANARADVAQHVILEFLRINHSWIIKRSYSYYPGLMFASPVLWKKRKNFSRPARHGAAELNFMLAITCKNDSCQYILAAGIKSAVSRSHAGGHPRWNYSRLETRGAAAVLNIFTRNTGYCANTYRAAFPRTSRGGVILYIDLKLRTRIASSTLRLYVAFSAVHTYIRGLDRVSKMSIARSVHSQMKYYSWNFSRDFIEDTLLA